MKIQNRFFLLASIAVAASGLFAVLYPTGAPAGYTGSPADAKTCTECHGGTASAVTDWITTNIPAGGYIPGTTYQLTVTNKLAGSGKYGFELSPQSDNGTYLGTLAAGSGSKLVGTKYITHSSSSSTQKSWTFGWTAPARGTGAVTFYAAFAQGKPGLVSKTSLTVQESTTTGIAAVPAGKLQLYPNPAHGQVKLMMPLSANVSREMIILFDMNGKQVLQTNAQVLEDNDNIISVEKLPPGIYFVSLSGNVQATSKLVVK